MLVIIIKEKISGRHNTTNITGSFLVNNVNDSKQITLGMFIVYISHFFFIHGAIRSHAVAIIKRATLVALVIPLLMIVWHDRNALKIKSNKLTAE